MSIRVRFAPSPTGPLHIGGARTALYCHLLAKKCGGDFVLRIEDTDQERSERHFEEAIIDDLAWLGINHTEGPLRQSERLDIYRRFAQTLLEQGKAYRCFLSPEELDELSTQAQEKNLAPHAYHGRYRDFPDKEAQARAQAGQPYVLRFKNPQQSHNFEDIIRGNVNFGADMVGDFVIMRSDDTPVYNFCCTVDDMLMKITHVIRAEEHLPNTLRQLILYQALEHTPPRFAHVSLLVGKDRQKLSKRHGATSVAQYKNDNYLPAALDNYLCLLGWTHPREVDIFTMDEIAKLFELKDLHKAPALYDATKLDHFNGEHMRRLESQQLISYLAQALPEEHPFHAQSDSWKQQCTEFFKDKFNTPREFPELLNVLFAIEESKESEYLEIKNSEEGKQIRHYLAEQIAPLPPQEFIGQETFTAWTKHIKSELKIKGKPLFKGLRAALTLQTEGPDLKAIIPLTPAQILAARVSHE